MQYRQSLATTFKQQPELSKSLTLALQTNHTGLLETIVKNNYILIIPPDLHLEEYTKIPQSKITEYIFMKSKFLPNRFMNLNGKHFEITQNGTKIRRLCRDIRPSQTGKSQQQLLNSKPEVQIISENVIYSTKGSYHRIFIDSLLDQNITRITRADSTINQQKLQIDSVRIYVTMGRRNELKQLFEKALTQDAIQKLRSSSEDSVASQEQQQPPNYPAGPITYTPAYQQNDKIKKIVAQTLQNSVNLLNQIYDNVALIKNHQIFFMDHLRKKTKDNWQNALQTLDQINHLKCRDQEMKPNLISNTLQCFVHQTLGDKIQNFMRKAYQEDEALLAKQIQHYRKRAGELEIPSVFNSCKLTKALKEFEKIQFPLYPFEMLKLLQSSVEKALIDLHEYGLCKDLPLPSKKQTKIDGENMHFLLAMLILKCKRNADTCLKACSVYMMNFTYYPNSINQSAYYATSFQFAIELIMKGKEDKLAASLDQQIVGNINNTRNQSVFNFGGKAGRFQQRPQTFASSVVISAPKVRGQDNLTRNNKKNFDKSRPELQTFSSNRDQISRIEEFDSSNKKMTMINTGSYSQSVIATNYEPKKTKHETVESFTANRKNIQSNQNTKTYKQPDNDDDDEVFNF